MQLNLSHVVQTFSPHYMTVRSQASQRGDSPNLPREEGSRGRSAGSSQSRLCSLQPRAWSLEIIPSPRSRIASCIFPLVAIVSRSGFGCIKGHREQQERQLKKQCAGLCGLCPWRLARANGMACSQPGGGSVHHAIQVPIAPAWATENAFP